MASAEEDPNGNRKLATDLSQWADPLSKGVAAIAIAVYACGFLIVSLHHSHYGFIGTNPFRPRILAAGAWFLFFLSMAITAAATYCKWPWTKLAQNAVLFWSFWLGFSFPFSWMLFESAASVHSFLSWVAAAAIAASLGTIARYKKASTPVAVASVAIALYFVLLEVRAMITNNFQTSSVSLWFFGVFVVAIVELKVRMDRNLGEGGEWAKPLAPLFIVLLVFAQYYYPHMKASWGGGAPVNVTIYFSKDSPISPNKSVLAQLVEESDEGFYIVGPKETKAIYVPRNAVALVYFSDKVADSSLLSNPK